MDATKSPHRGRRLKTGLNRDARKSLILGKFQLVQSQAVKGDGSVVDEGENYFGSDSVRNETLIPLFNLVLAAQIEKKMPAAILGSLRGGFTLSMLRMSWTNLVRGTLLPRNTSAKMRQPFEVCRDFSLVLCCAYYFCTD